MNAQEIISKLTIEEKCALLGGKNEWMSRNIDRLGIPSVFFSDGPHGLRRQGEKGDHLGLGGSLPATCFPTAATAASSWDEDLAEKIGDALGQEANAQHVDVLLGPGLNVKRSPLCGRNFEYFSEDPYLAGKMAAGYIRGIQRHGVYSCPKHFAVNSREYRRMAMNAVVDERTLREIYLTAFEMAVKEGGAKAIMSSYNRVNGTYVNENEHLLKDILRGEWGYDGMIVTDWGASNDVVAGVKATSTIEMPTPGLGSARTLLEAYNDGVLLESEIDRAIKPLIEGALYFKGQQHDDGIKKDEHHELARYAAENSMVLLKNDDNILPLKKGTKVAVIGDFAITPRYQGAGSSIVNATKIETICDALKDYPLEIAGLEKGYVRTGKKPDQEAYDAAVALASKADVVLYFFGLDEVSETEGGDRMHMRIPAIQEKLLNDIARVNPNVVGVLSAGSALETPWIDNVKALLNTVLTGQAGGTAVMNVLTGRVNPSGKLMESWPLKYEDCSVANYSGQEGTHLEYREGLFVGYRYYDTAGIRVRFPFGYGLSYSTFAYSDIEVEKDRVSFTITNTSAVDGKEISELYVGLKGSKVVRPKKELKGFKKTLVKAGESVRVSIPFDDKTFRFFNDASNAWETEGGEYDIYVCASSDDVRLAGKHTVAGSMTSVRVGVSDLPSYAKADIMQVGDAEFIRLYGHELPREHGGDFDINDPFCEMYRSRTWALRKLSRVLKKNVEKAAAQGIPDLNALFIYNMPLRALGKMAGGMVSMEMAEAVLTMANGHFWKGFNRFIGGFFRNKRLNKKYEKMLSEIR